jgi:hypothetical protein
LDAVSIPNTSFKNRVVATLYSRSARSSAAFCGLVRACCVPLKSRSSKSNLSGPQLADHGVHLGERRSRIFGPVEDQHSTLDVLRRFWHEVAE